MTPDIKIKDFYLRYIHNAKKELEDYIQLGQTIKESILSLYDNINENKILILETFNINLDNYESEYINMVYDESESLYFSVINKLKMNIKEDNSLLILLEKLIQKR